MKTVFALCILFVVSCKSNYVVSQHIIQKSNACPENSVCSVELIPNKTIEFKVDKFGIVYPVISEGEKTLLKYTFNKNPIAKTQDSNYTEIIYAELDSTITELDLTDDSLQDVKLYFGRLCYCKGATGYYPIKKGTFKLSKASNSSIKIDVNFKISEVPQIISEIRETITLKSN
jgi:hypothetical protein